MIFLFRAVAVLVTTLLMTSRYEAKTPVLGVGLAFLRLFFDKRVTTEEEIEKHLHFPVIDLKISNTLPLDIQQSRH